MIYPVSATLLILWWLGLENSRSFGALFYALLAFATLVLAATALEKRGRLERQRQEMPLDRQDGRPQA